MVYIRATPWRAIFYAVNLMCCEFACFNALTGLSFAHST